MSTQRTTQSQPKSAALLILVKDAWLKGCAIARYEGTSEWSLIFCRHSSIAPQGSSTAPQRSSTAPQAPHSHMVKQTAGLRGNSVSTDIHPDSVSIDLQVRSKGEWETMQYSLETQGYSSFIMGSNIRMRLRGIYDARSSACGAWTWSLISWN